MRVRSALLVACLALFCAALVGTVGQALGSGPPAAETPVAELGP